MLSQTWLRLLIFTCAGIFTTSAAHSQQYSMEDLNCAATYDTLSLQTLKAISVRINVTDPLKIQTNDSLKATLDAALSDVLTTCKGRGVVGQSLVKVAIYAGSEFLYQAQMSANDRRWETVGDNRARVIASILERKQKERDLQEAIARGPSTTQDKLCAAAGSFRKEQAELSAIAAQLQKEPNPIKQKEGMDDLTAKRNALSKKADDWFENGGRRAWLWEQRVQNIPGIVSKIYAFNLGGEGIRLEVSLPCPTSVTLLMAFPLKQYGDYVSGTFNSDFDRFKSTLKEINKGDKITFSGFLIQPGHEPNFSTGFFTDPTALSIRIDSLTRN